VSGLDLVHIVSALFSSLTASRESYFERKKKETDDWEERDILEKIDHEFHILASLIKKIN